MVSDNRMSKVQELVYEIRVGDVMTDKVVTVNPQTPMSQLRGMLKEQLCCLGRVFARHQVPDDVVWEVVKGFDLIYQKAKRQAESPANEDEPKTSVHKMEPHPGITYLLEKIEK